MMMEYIDAEEFDAAELDLILASDHSLPPVHRFPTEYKPDEKNISYIINH